jgi:hypothetical protein
MSRNKSNQKANTWVKTGQQENGDNTQGQGVMKR